MTVGNSELAITFKCGDSTLIGIVHASDSPAKRGVLVVVGGPQYRAGSHRQFVSLARALAAQQVPTMRFDHRGIGDSDDPYRGFEALDLDIASAIDAFMRACPSLTDVVLWGLCDAASAILFYAHRDPRVVGIVLLNPWVRTPEGEARAYLRHYYRQRLLDPMFWRRVLAGQINVQASARSFSGFVRRRLAGTGGPAQNRNSDAKALPDRMADSLATFKGPVLLIISGQDLTAREFEDAVLQSRTWQRLLADPRVSRRDLPPADHTFSRAEWSDTVSR
jgi:uncharacterized protein